MRTRDLFFSFKGRTSRGQWWLGCCGLLVGSVVAVIALAILLLYVVPIGEIRADIVQKADGSFSERRSSLAYNIAIGLVAIGAALMFLALSIKRLRDADVSGAVLILMFIPILFGIGLPFAVDPPGAAMLPTLAIGLLCYIPLWSILGFKGGREPRERA
ncbi:DUF805 domain-containing protein [Aureimonas sp. AU40]|uniref:DUF805 domain-containing protein n=1 Tax=Aureimonas sp. AU40 TaxID=1637747 RepID=UPI0007814787|nr:DUF805 domain-containing protein [Aureimonas sp. AU40]